MFIKMACKGKALRIITFTEYGGVEFLDLCFFSVFYQFFHFKHEICTGDDSQSKEHVKVDLET